MTISSASYGGWAVATAETPIGHNTRVRRRAERGNARSPFHKLLGLLDDALMLFLANISFRQNHLTSAERGAGISAWEATLRVAGITDRAKKIDGDLRWDDLRHECGSRLAEGGMDVRRVQELLGHATITTTERYFNTSVEAIAAGLRKAMGG